jgi:sugar phosphate isomerase/epimerase
MKFGATSYIVREQIARDPAKAFDQLRAMGYEGVEMVGLPPSLRPQEIRKALDGAGVRAIGSHTSLQALQENAQGILEDNVALGGKYLTVSHGKLSEPGSVAFQAMQDQTRAMIDLFGAEGITLHYHNHGWDNIGSPSYTDAVLGALGEAGLKFEPDLGWFVIMQVDPVAYLTRYASLCRVIHLKDVYVEDFALLGDGRDLAARPKHDPERGRFAFRPVGYGVVNYARIFPYCLACDPDWIIVDQDMCYDRDPMEELRLSVEYLQALTLL